MKACNIILFMFWFFAFVLLFGDMYLKFNISYQTTFIVTVVLSVMLAAGMITETLIGKKR